MKLIITDIDETILHFAEHFETWMNNMGFPTIVHLRTLYNISSSFGITEELKYDLLNKFANEQFHNMKPEKDALEVLPRLYERGYNFVAVSACADTSEISKNRQKNLENVFGFPWQNVHCIGWDGCKSHILKFYQNSIWVEDNMYHAKKGSEIGHDTYLIRRPYNLIFRSNEVQVVDSWYDIEKLIQ